MEMIDNKLIWKKCDQDKYYSIICEDYIKKIFEFIKNKNFAFYVEYDKNAFDIIYKYYNSETIDINDFEKKKSFKHYSLFPLYDKNKNVHDVDDSNFGFTILDYDDSKQLSGCNKCGMQYGGNIWFKGMAHNTGLDNDNPIPYEGYIKTYYFFRCNCEEDKDQDEIIYQKPDDDNEYFDSIPWLEIRCYPTESKYDKYNLCMLRNCILFNIKYTEI